MLSFAIGLPGFALGVYLGSAEMVAVIFLAANLLLLLPFQAYIARLLNLRLAEVLREWVAPITSSLIMVIAMLLIRYVFTGSALLELLTLTLVGLVTFTGSLLLIFPSFAQRNLAYVRHLTKKDYNKV